MNHNNSFSLQTATKNEFYQQFVTQLKLLKKESEILSFTVTQVRNFLNTERVLFFQLQEGWDGNITVESVSNEELSIIGLKVSDPCFGAKYKEEYRQGKITMIEDIFEANLSLCHIEFLTSLKVKSNLVIPLVFQYNLYGLLIAHSCEYSRKWKGEEINILKAIITEIVPILFSLTNEK